MSAFYVMRYVGTDGQGGGALYIGRGLVVGVDVLGGTYDGKYTETHGRIKGTVKMTAPKGGAVLVTGQHVPSGTSFDLTFDFPAEFANGKPQSMVGVGGMPVQVTFEKLKDLP